jgi:predicted nucleic acid-binding protein
MKNKYFLDTSYILALEIRNERNHQQVLQNWFSLSTLNPTLVTTSYVFDEVVTFLNSRNLHDKAVDVGNRLLHSPNLDFIEINSTLFNQGWIYFQVHKDKSYSLTDCLSFVVMQQKQIMTALTLDNHFRQAGFQVLP